jgi:hypothetical protein
MATKLNLVQMVDRGALTPNEWREVMNLPPIAGGDEAIRRLDTAVVGAASGTGTLDLGAQASAVSAVQQTTGEKLNGAQVQSLIEVIKSVKDGVLGKSAAIEVITTAFGISADKASNILNDAL